jgi:UDP-3-O-[3-hydroxymyristoyl] glucosamine N-acyltransferase
VTNDVPDGARMIGIPATPERDQKVKQAAFSKLPEMRRQLKILQREVERLVREQSASGKLSLAAEESPDDTDTDGRRAVA